MPKNTIAIVAYETNAAVNSSMMMHVDMIRDAGYRVTLFVQKTVNLDYFRNYDYPIVTFNSPKELSALFVRNNIEKVWCTNPMYVLKLVHITKLPIYLWKQGDTASESFMKHRNYLRKWVLQLIDAYTLRRVAGVVYVSESMKNYYENKYNIKAKNIIVPCLSEFADYETSVERMPNSFVYIGGLSVWQCFDEILQIYAKIRTPDSIFHVITLEVDDAKKKVLHYIGDDKNIEIYGINDRKLIPEVLHRFQYGFLIRKNDIVNMVAAPIKFLEYLSCGVNVIMTNAITSYAKIVEEKDLGTVININSKSICINKYNPSAKQVYKELFNRQSYVEEYSRLLSSK